jgi:hypothetical protein
MIRARSVIVITFLGSIMHVNRIFFLGYVEELCIIV